MLKVYNGNFETVFEPDRLFVKDSLDGGKGIFVGKYFGVGPAGELKGIVEEAVRISYPWLGGLKGFLSDVDAQTLELLESYIEPISGGLERDKFIEEFSAKTENRFSRKNLEQFHDVVSRTDRKVLSGGIKSLQELMFKLEDELHRLAVAIKNSFAKENELDEAIIRAVVERELERFAERVEQTYGVKNIGELLKVEIFPFP
jgi:hypothetical protein